MGQILKGLLADNLLDFNGSVYRIKAAKSAGLRKANWWVIPAWSMMWFTEVLPVNWPWAISSSSATWVLHPGEQASVYPSSVPDGHGERNCNQEKRDF